MKKILTTVLVGTISIATLSACGDDKTPGTNESTNNYSDESKNATDSSAPEDENKTDEVLAEEDSINETVMSFYGLLSSDFPIENQVRILNSNEYTQQDLPSLSFLEENSDFDLDNYFYFDDLSEEDITKTYIHVIGVRSLFPTNGSVEKITVGEDDKATVAIKEEIQYPDEFIESQKEAATLEDGISAVLSTDITYIEVELKKIDGKWKINPETYFMEALGSQTG